MEDKLYSTDSEGKDILNYIFNDSSILYKAIVPNGWVNSEYIHFFHPTPEEQYEEHKIFTDNINRLLKGRGKEEEKYADKSEFKQDDLTNIPEQEEFLYVLGLAVYDIFSNNHEVIGPDGKIYDFGSFRGSGRFIADFFNEVFDDLSKEYDYINFYMGSFGIQSRADLKPFYEYIFNKLKELNCDWNYFFPRLFLIDPKKALDIPADSTPDTYDPGKAMQEEIEQAEKDKKMSKLQEDLEKAYQDEYEETKYKPLDAIIQAYKNIYGVSPKGHPQKEFE